MVILLNALGFKTVWLLSLVGAGSDMPWLGASALALFLLWHLTVSPMARADLGLVALAVALGFAADTLLVRAGLLAYASPVPFATAAPFWIVLMWANFALTLNSSMRWLQGRYLLAGVLGAVGGPLAYLAGIKLGAAQPLAEAWLLYGVLALIWAAAVPLLALAATRLGRRLPAEAAPLTA